MFCQQVWLRSRSLNDSELTWITIQIIYLLLVDWPIIICRDAAHVILILEGGSSQTGRPVIQETWCKAPQKWIKFQRK